MNRKLRSIIMFNADDGGGTGGGAGGGAGGEGEGGASGQVEMVEKIDPVTKKTFKIPKELESVLGHYISATRSEIEGKYKPMVDSLQSDNAELSSVRSAYDALLEESQTAEEKAINRNKKLIEGHEKATLEAQKTGDAWKGRFESTKIDNDVLSSFGEISLCNSYQTAMLLKMEGSAHIEEIVDNEGKGTGKFETVVTLMLEDKEGEIEEVTGKPTELFKRWIELDRNAHHIPNSMSSGSGARGGGASGKGKDLSNLDPIERLKAIRREEQGR